MAAAVKAMKPVGFAPDVVTAKMKELIKEYEGEYFFIEQDAYKVLLDALIEDQQNENQHEQNQVQVVHEEAANVNEIIEGERDEEGQAIVPATSFIDIPVCPSTPLPILPPSSPKPMADCIPTPPSPQLLVDSISPPPPPPVLDEFLLLQPPPPSSPPPSTPPPSSPPPPSPPPPPPVLDASQPLWLPPPLPPSLIMASTLPPPPMATDLRRPLINNHHILTIKDQDSPQFATPTNQDSIFIDTHLENNDRLLKNDGFGHNPYGILGSNGFEVAGSTTVDPFRNQTPKIVGVYEWLKMVVILPIAIVRLVLFGLCLVVGYVATKCALYGWKDKTNPMPRWRCRVMWITRLCSRGILFSFGYHWIQRKGRPAPRDTAPIVVSNHVSYIDPIFFFYESSPTIVASDSHDSMPFVGVIIRAMQVIYVNRFSYQSRKQAVNEIKRKASSVRFPRVLLFPEGTTTNGRQLIYFQLGAFIPGYPIQPVVIRYPHVHFDQSWGHISLATLMFRMFMQFHNFMEVEYLPVISPSQHQKESAARFAEKTGKAMASALNVVQTNHSFADYALLSKAAKAGRESYSPFMVEMAKVQKSCHLSSAEAVEFLETFLTMNPDNSGCVKYQDFIRVLRLKPSRLSENIFGFIDVEKNGVITFKEFLVGSAHVLRLPLFQRACEVAFNESDEDKDQYLTMQQLGGSTSPAIPNMDTNETCALFDLFDTDGDGRISKDDFMTCLRKNPLLIAHFNHHFVHKDLNTETSMDELV